MPYRAPFVGYTTTGGVDEETPGDLWVENLFKRESRHIYCSRDNARNMNISGMLKANVPLTQRDYLHLFI